MIKKIMIVLAASVALAICLMGYFNKADPEKMELGERYDSNKIAVCKDSSKVPVDNSGKIILTEGIGPRYVNRLDELFDEYSKSASETEFSVHENTAIAIAEAVMRELYPNDNYGVVHLPTYFRPGYYKAENCWEVWLHRNALYTRSISESDPKTDKVMLVYVDVNSGAVRAIIPADEFSVHNPANSD